MCLESLCHWKAPSIVNSSDIESIEARERRPKRTALLRILRAVLKQLFQWSLW